jgi:hypothetical protein
MTSKVELYVNDPAQRQQTGRQSFDMAAFLTES